MGAMPNLGKRTIDAARPAEREFFLWCGSTRGFGVRVYPSGNKIFVAQVRIGRAQRRVKIGPFGPLTVEDARKRAVEVIRLASAGRDPQQERRDARAAISVADLCDLYLDAARSGLVTTRFGRPKSASTVAIDEGRISRHIKPLLKHIPARDLTRVIVQRMADDIAKGKTAGIFKGKPRGRAVVQGGPKTAARVVELLGGIYSWAEKRGYVAGINPVRGVEKSKGSPKDRVLSPEELLALGKTLQDAGDDAAAEAIKLIALTGLRRQEACGLKWKEVDFENHALRLETSKTGRSIRPIGRTALNLLRSNPNHSEWVFPNRSKTGSADLKKAISILFDAAGLKDARAHDLRRTFASAAADEGYSDATIAELLGHARSGVTARHYIRRPDAALIAAADRVANRIASSMDSSHPGAEVVPLHRIA
jgi:integrase